MILKDIDKDNFIECIFLKVPEHQNEFVASNAFSLAESKFYPQWWCVGIYHDNRLIGFAMYGPDDNDRKRMWLIRLMISGEYQGEGLGKEALNKIIRIVREMGYSEFRVSTKAANSAAINLYRSLGFIKTGEIIENEEVFQLNL